MRHALSGMTVLAAMTLATAADAQGGKDGATHEVRVQDVRTRVDDIQDRVRQIRAALQALGGDIVPIEPFGPRALLVLKNDMSGAFRLARVRAYIDEQIEFVRDDAALADQTTVPIYVGALAPGEHTVRIELRFKGNGALVPYMEAYTFDAVSSRKVTTVGPKPIAVTFHAFERGDATTPLESRPAIEWQERILPAR